VITFGNDPHPVWIWKTVDFHQFLDWFGAFVHIHIIQGSNYDSNRPVLAILFTLVELFVV